MIIITWSTVARLVECLTRHQGISCGLSPTAGVVLYPSSFLEGCTLSSIKSSVTLKCGLGQIQSTPNTFLAIKKLLARGKSFHDKTFVSLQSCWIMKVTISTSMHLLSQHQ